MKDYIYSVKVYCMKSAISRLFQCVNNLFLDLSNDSYGTVVNMGLDGEGSSPGGAGGGPPRGYLGATTPPYISTSRSPSLPPQFPYPSDAGLSVYTTLGKYHFLNSLIVFFCYDNNCLIINLIFILSRWTRRNGARSSIRFEQ